MYKVVATISIPENICQLFKVKFHILNNSCCHNRDKPSAFVKCCHMLCLNDNHKTETQVNFATFAYNKATSGAQNK